MFRGGRVDSRGTGITSGLGYNAGGRVGYQVGGTVTLQDILKQTGAPMTGSQILQYAQNKNLNLGPNFKINPYSKFIPENVEVSVGEDVVEKPFSEILRTEGFQTYEDPKGYLGSSDTQGTTSDTLGTVSVKLDEKGKIVKDELGNPIYTGNQGQIKKILEEKTPTVITGEGVDLGDDDTTVGQTDLQDMISRYEELLGGGKARQRDVGDILGRASAAFLGAGDVREGLAEFMKAESQAGPSRTEKIKQAAAMLGIKGEQAKELYETKLKNTKGMFTKKVEDIMRSNDVDRRQATKMALGEPGTIGEAFVRYREKVGFPPSGVDFDALAEGYTSGPLPEDYATSKPTGTFYIPGEMVIVEMENGVQKSVRSYK
jgi:hypothetical protein